MSSKNSGRPLNNRYMDNNHWYSSDYWRSDPMRTRRRPTSDYRQPPQPRPPSDAERNETHNSKIDSNCFWDLRPDSYPNSKQLKRVNDYPESTQTPKRKRTTDPFDSPEPLIKDFRLSHPVSRGEEMTHPYDSFPHKTVNSSNDLFCQKCDQIFRSSLDFSNHLNGERHKSVATVTEKGLICDNQRQNECKRLKRFEDFNQLQRLLQRFTEPIVGLDFIKETEPEVFSCNLCKCFSLRLFNAVEHIRGYRHQRNFEAQKKLKEFTKNSLKPTESPKRRSEKEKRSVSSSTQTSAESEGENRISRRSVRNCQTNSRPTVVPLTPTPTQSSSVDSIQNLLSESQSERYDSCKKTIENFKTIRNICDQMIGYFTEKQNSVTNAKTTSGCKSLARKAFPECLPLEMKKENPV